MIIDLLMSFHSPRKQKVPIILYKSRIPHFIYSSPLSFFLLPPACPLPRTYTFQSLQAPLPKGPIFGHLIFSTCSNRTFSPKSTPIFCLQSLKINSIWNLNFFLVCTNSMEHNNTSVGYGLWRSFTRQQCRLTQNFSER